MNIDAARDVLQEIKADLAKELMVNATSNVRKHFGAISVTSIVGKVALDLYVTERQAIALDIALTHTLGKGAINNVVRTVEPQRKDLAMKLMDIAGMAAKLDGLVCNAVINVARLVKGHFVIETTGLVLPDVLMAIQDQCVTKVGIFDLSIISQAQMSDRFQRFLNVRTNLYFGLHIAFNLP